MKRSRNPVGLLLLLVALLAPAAPCAAYPDKPVSIIVSVGPGAGPDVIARILAERFTAAWGQQVLIVNRPGGGGVIAAQAAALASPDGYTLYMPVSSAFTVLPESKTKIPVDLSTDFRLVGLIGDQPMVIAAASSLGVHTLPDFIAYAKQHPGEVLYGASRLSVPHMTGELLQMRSDIQMGYVPTTGIAKVVQDIMSGNLSVAIESMPGLAGAVQAGTVKALAVASDKRLTAYPDLPLVSETLPGFIATGWFALMAPAKTPDAIVAQLESDLRAALSDPELNKKFEQIGIAPRPLSVAETMKFIHTEQDLWRPIVRQIGAE
jgi:tripartite-type tricarboxylate transporter receptor subunit TctC